MKLAFTGKAILEWVFMARSAQVLAVSTLQRSPLSSGRMTLSKMSTDVPLISAVVITFRHSSSSLGAENISPARPVATIAITSQTNDLPVPAWGASRMAKGAGASIAGLMMGVNIAAIALA